MKDDVIYRQQAIDALWKALHEYEDKTEKQFQESDDLDVGDWIQHRIFVQNMSDIDRKTILALQSAQPEQKSGRWIAHEDGKFVGFPYMHYECSQCRAFEPTETNFCPNCGADMRGDTE